MRSASESLHVVDILQRGSEEELYFTFLPCDREHAILLTSCETADLMFAVQLQAVMRNELLRAETFGDVHLP